MKFGRFKGRMLYYWDRIKLEVAASAILKGERKVFDKVESYVMFVGYPRSGHTVIGAILDAHPNIILAHELNVLHYIRKGYERSRIFAMLLYKSRMFIKQGAIWTGYSYKVPNQFQGRFTDLKIIGDKRGGASSRMLSTNLDLLRDLRKTVDMPVKIIHIMRNPFDNITTRARDGNDVLREIDESMLSAAMDDHFKDVETISRIKKELNFDMIDIRHEDFINKSESELKKLGDFLGVEMSDEYIKDCVSIVFKKAHKSRLDVPWTDELKEEVDKRVDSYDFMKGYTFES